MLTPRAAFFGAVIGTAGAIGAAIGGKSTVNPHDNYYHLVFNGESSCSGTSVGPHAILTADHCFDRIRSLVIDRLGIVQVADVIRDGNDHVILILDKSMPTWDEFGPMAKQGDDVSIYHSPGNFTDMYSRGYMAGRAAPTGVDVSLYDLPAFYGSSGAAILNKDNQIVGVVNKISFMTNGKAHYQTVLAFDMKFTDKQMVSVRQ